MKLAQQSGIATGAIDNAHAVMSSMGSRFLFAREPEIDRSAQGGRARGHAGKERGMRAEIAGAVSELLGNLPTDEPVFPEHLHDRIVALADVAALARSPVECNYRSEVELVLEAEAPTRLVKQLAQLLRGMLWVGFDEATAWDAIVRVGLDSIPQLRRRVIDTLLASPAAHLTTREIASRVDHPTPTVLRALEDLAAHGVVEREGEGQGQTYKWWISDYALARLLSATSSGMSEQEQSS